MLSQPVPDYTQSEIQTDAVPTKKFGRYLVFFILFLCLTALGIMLYVHTLAQPPRNFPVGENIEVLPGTAIATITKNLKEQGVVSSDLLLYLVLLTQYEPKSVKASTYNFSEPMDVYSIAHALVTGDFDTDLISFTHIEGERATHIAKNAETQLENFSATEFLLLASTSEGKLFPETYRIPKNFTPQQLFTLMTESYEKNISPLRPLFKLVDLKESEVVILASIIEREANSTTSMKIVSGILQNRLRIGMGLQVDASMEYMLDKPLKELTAEDLKIDSPYNTYLYRGLPPTAIGNPGLDALQAVLEPTVSKNMFYITGADGNFYYAETFDQHKQNIANYLK